MTDPQTLLALAVEVAREAGEVAVEHAGTAGVGVRTKTTATDVVTEGDRATERLIVRRLHERRPGDTVLGEEGGARGAQGGQPTGVRWLVDPIDGTVNYLYGIPQYAVSIAAECDGEVVAGVVFDPVKAELYAATRGGGATCNGTPIECSGGTELDQSLVATGFSYSAERRAKQARVLGGVLPAVRDIRRMGAASLDLCAVACGRVDAYYEKGLSPWDVAAGALVAREAGATLHGAGDYYVAATPAVFDRLVRLLAELGAPEA